MLNPRSLPSLNTSMHMLEESNLHEEINIILDAVLSRDDGLSISFLEIMICVVALLHEGRWTLDDVERISRGKASKAKTGSRAVPHRLQAGERKVKNSPRVSTLD